MGGLSAAIRLQLAGYNVEIYEKNQTPGGKMSQIKAEDILLTWDLQLL